MQSQIELPSVSARSTGTAMPSDRRGLLSRLSVSQKLGLSAASFLIPLAALLAFLVSEQQQNINFVNTELEGAQYLTPTRQLFQQMQLHAQNSVQMLQGSAPAQTEVSKATSGVETAIEALKTLDTRDTGAFGISKAVSEFQTSWQKIRDQVSSRQITPEDNIQAHSVLLKQISGLFVIIANSSQIALDPEQNAYYLGQLVTVQLPQNYPVIGITRAASLVAIRSNQPLTEAKRVEYGFRLAEATAAQDEILNTLSYTVPVGNDTERASTVALRKQYAQNMGALINTFGQNIATPTLPTITLPDYIKVNAASNIAQYALFDNVLSDLKAQLALRQAGYIRNRLITLGLVVLALLLALALLIAIARAITRPLGQLARASQRLAAGDLAVEVPVTTSDEVGTVSTAFNTAVKQLRSNEEKNIQARQESEKLQANVGEFLDVTMDIADGDLTRRGKVTEDVLGNVVDSINLMTEELAQVLKGVQQASHSVTDGSAQMLTTTADIQSGAQLTATEAGRVAGQVQAVIAQIREMAQSAQASAESARQALLASQQGQTAVAGTLDGMQNIRREVQGVARRIKGLGDRSLEIQEIVDTISQIASQTNLLALNAAIEAAGAGEAGSRFAVVADEVRKLADNSAQATARIATLIRSVQTEIQDVIVSVEDGTREVEQGYRVAGTAGERLREIGTLAQQSASLAESISSATQLQVQGMEQVGGAVQEIAQIADRSRVSVEKGRLAADQLQALATQMNVGLARFRLPG
jgi:twitching motility protein PilJ